MRYSGHLVSHLTVSYHNTTKQAEFPIMWKEGAMYWVFNLEVTLASHGRKVPKSGDGKSKGGGDLETSCYTAEVSFSLGFSPLLKEKGEMFEREVKGKRLVDLVSSFLK